MTKYYNIITVIVGHDLLQEKFNCHVVIIYLHIKFSVLMKFYLKMDYSSIL